MNHRLLAFVLCVLGPSTFLHAQDVAQLLKYLPDDANAIVVLRVRELLESPRAQREGWADEAEAKFLAGSMTVPPWIDRFVRGTYIRPGTRDEPRSVAVLASSRPIRMGLVAQREEALLETISEKPAVLSKRDCYFVQLDDQLLGVISPAFRQDVARWIQRNSQSADSGLSDYLRNAATDPAPHILLALDMQDMIEPNRLRARLSASPVLAGMPSSVESVARELESLRGIRLAVNVEDDAAAAIHLDFAAEVSQSVEYLKPLFLEFLAELGGELQDFEGAEVSQAGRTVTFRTALSDEDLRKIMSLIVAQNPQAPTSADAPSTPDPAGTRPEPAQTTADGPASIRYFNAVSTKLDDLQRASRRSSNASRTAAWHDNFAEQIENLPTYGVDPELIDYGALVSRNLHALAASLRGIAVQVDALEKTVTYDFNYDPGWASINIWGGISGRPASLDVSSNLADVRAKQADAVAQGADERRAIWTMINDARSSTRRNMIGKYGDEFQRRAK